MLLSPRALLLSGLLASAVAMAATPSRAEGDKQEALRLYNDAKRKLASERYREAAEGFEAANRAYTSANILFAAGQAWDRAGESARAADAYSRALAIGDFKADFDQRARDELRRLSKGLGSVKVESAEGAVVRIDDHSEYPAPIMLFASPGSHLLHIVRKDGSKELRKVEVERGKVRVENADTRPPRKPEPAPPSAGAEGPATAPPETASAPPRLLAPTRPAGDDLLRLSGFTTAGLGVGVLGAGLFMGLRTADAADAYNADPNRASYDHASDMATTTNVLLIAGGVLAATGAGLIVWSYLQPQERGAVTLSLRPTGVSAQGSF